MSSRTWTMIYAALAGWNAYYALDAFAKDRIGWGVWGFVIFAWCAWRFAQGVMCWNANEVEGE
jgi:hypothetical protein